MFKACVRMLAGVAHGGRGHVSATSALERHCQRCTNPSACLSVCLPKCLCAVRERKRRAADVLIGNMREEEDLGMWYMCVLVCMSHVHVA